MCFSLSIWPNSYFLRDFKIFLPRVLKFLCVGLISSIVTAFRGPFIQETHILYVPEIKSIYLFIFMIFFPSFSHFSSWALFLRILDLLGWPSNFLFSPPSHVLLFRFTFFEVSSPFSYWPCTEFFNFAILFFIFRDCFLFSEFFEITFCSFVMDAVSSLTFLTISASFL